MLKLIETKLQKFILFIGGILILLRLWEVSYYERYTAILTSIGILIFTVILLIILRDFHPKINFKIIKKGLLIILSVVLMIIFVLLISRINWQYFSFDRDKCIQEVAIKYANKQANSIDFNSYIKDLSLEEIDSISKIFNADKNLLTETKQNDWNLIQEINKKDILFIYNNPKWMENNLKRVGDLIKNRIISKNYIEELTKQFKNSDISDIYCKPSLFK